MAQAIVDTKKTLTVGEVAKCSGVSQRVGVSLAEIRAALDSLPEGRTPKREDWAALSARWKAPGMGRGRGNGGT